MRLRVALIALLVTALPGAAAVATGQACPAGGR